MDKPKFEAIKEFGRLALLWIASTVVAALIVQLSDWNLPPLFVEVLTGLLRLIDKYIHEVKTGNLKKVNGLLPF